MENIALDIKRVFSFVPKETIYGYKEEVTRHLKNVHARKGAGSEMLGWLNLPSSITNEMIDDYRNTALSFKKNKIEVVLVIGIGGSYLGSKAVTEALLHNFHTMMPAREFPTLVFAGNNIGEDFTSELLELLEHKSFGIISISKSGTTTEPALAFRIFRELLERKVGKEKARELIVAITDKTKGALKTLATSEGYKTFVIPDDVGGRYSVFTPVGLVPIAIAGFDIKSFIQGARDMEKLTDENVPFEDNIASLYAATRNALYKNGKTTEILANYNNKLNFLAEWWKQLFGESEGKENKGIFPASVNFTADLHSMGQYIQEGARNLFEIVLSIDNPNARVSVPSDKDNLDGLNFLSGKRINEVNKMAELGTMIAHVDGGVPNIHINIPTLNEYYLGQIMYFFEKACAISGYTLGVNPFNQPGVEAYKKNMFALLEKPGFEEETKKIKSRL